MSLNKKFAQLQEKPILLSLRITGALIEEFSTDKDWLVLARTIRSENIKKAVKTVCQKAYSPALTKKQFKVNTETSTYFSNVFQKEIKTQESLLGKLS